VSSRYAFATGAIPALVLILSCGCGRMSFGRAAQGAGVTVTTQPVAFVTRTFDPANPPADMPPLSQGEQAECDSNFLSSATVGGDVRQTDEGHAWVTIAQINLQLQLNVTIWAPANASPHVIEHEQGHRRISEHYYQTAGDLAHTIAGNYIGQKVEISGTDFAGESKELFQRTANEITAEYNKQLNPEAAQLLYDRITDHGRNEVVVQDAVASAIKNAGMQPDRAAAAPGN
jgi:hypothetical protein